MAHGDRVLLVGCVKTKTDVPTAAKDLYRSPLWAGRRAYAEQSGAPWFILSSRWGLIEPGEVIAPYDMYLADQPVSYRRAWGSFVVAQLRLRGLLDGRTFEVHAGQAYLEPLVGPLEQAGCVVTSPAGSRSFGELLLWYKVNAAISDADESVVAAEEPAVAEEEEPGLPEMALVDRLVEDLSDGSMLVTVPDLLIMDATTLAAPGVYSWWVDTSGAADLAAGLAEPFEAGLIYVGQAGATRWPSGKRSSSTLWTRLAGMHLAGSAEFSTFRRTLGAVLMGPLALDGEDDPKLSSWMHQHLRVRPVVYADADLLSTVEATLLGRLDPPLNLKGVPRNPIRDRVRELRANSKGSAKK